MSAYIVTESKTNFQKTQEEHEKEGRQQSHLGKHQLLRNGRGRERCKKWPVKEARNLEGNDRASKSFFFLEEEPTQCQTLQR